MANTIRLKRGSGSDPSASDLVVGELAIRTDSGKIFTKKDNGNVAEISGGGGIDDGDKGDITVSNGGDTFTIDNGVVTSAKIADGTIVDADISGSAAIAGSKLQAAGLVNAGSMSAANFNKLAGIEANATADMTGTEILATISGENIILGEIASTGNSTFAGNVTLSSSDGGSSAAPELDLYRISASPADSDYLGQIKFSGEDAADNKQVYAKITGKAGDVTNLTEDGILEFMLTKAGSNNIAARFTSTDLKLINGTGLEVAGETDVATVNVGTNSRINFASNSRLQIHSNGTNSYLDYAGSLNVRGSSGSAAALTFLSNSNVLVSNDLDVDGNITCDGTIDGVDIATRDTLFGGLTSSSGVLTNGVTATTQSAGDNSTKVATTAYTDTAISNLVDSSPSTLNTLNELAAALGDDPNFATTVTNSIATKMPLAGGTFSGNIIARFITPDNDSQRDLGTTSVRWRAAYVDNYYGSGANLTNLPSQTDNNFTNADHSKLDGIESGATADQTASEILTLLKTVDGAGSGLDADTLDGISSASFLRSDANDTMTGQLTISRSADNQLILNRNISSTSNYYSGLQLEIRATSGTAGLSLHRNGNSHVGIYTDTSNKLEFDFNSGDVVLNHDAGTIWGSGNDGSGSGLDSDLLDGQEGSYYRNAGNLNAGTLLAARLGTASASEAGISVVGNFGQWETHGTYTNFNTEPNYWGWNYVMGSTNAPNTTSSQWYRCRLSLGSNYGKGSDSGDYSLEMALPRSNHSSAGVLHIRTIENGSEGSWTTVGDNASLISTGTLPAARLPNHSASLLTSGTIPAARVPTLNQNTTGSAATLTTARTIAGTSFNGSANIDISYTNLTNKLSVGDGGLTQKNFTTTLKNKLDGIASGATNVTNTNQLTNGAGFLTSVGTSNISNDAVTFAKIENIATGGIIGRNNSGTGSIERLTASEVRAIINVENGATADQSASEILTLIKTVDGAGSGLDADTLDGVSSGSFLRSDAVDSSSEDITINGLRVGEWTSASYKGIFHSSHSGSEYMMISNDTHTYISATTGHNVYLRASANSSTNQLIVSTGGVTIGGNTVLTTASGINASNINSGTIAAARVATLNQNTTGSSGSCTGNAATATRLQTARTIAGVSFNGTANISLNNNAITNGAGYVTSSVINSLNASNLSSGTIPDARFPSTLPAVDGSNLTGISAGATGGGSDEVFYENGQTVTTNYTITNGKNAMSAGPITINNGVTLTVGSGENLTIV